MANVITGFFLQFNLGDFLLLIKDSYKFKSIGLYRTDLNRK